MARPKMESLGDLAKRCTVDAATGCWHWSGAREGKFKLAPKVWINGVGSTSLQIALPLLALGRRAAPGVRYIPVCGDLHCANWSHRREGTQSELMTLAARIYTDRRVSAIRASGDRIRAGLAAYHQRRLAERPAVVKQTPKPKPKPKTTGPKLHDKRDRMGRAGVMPNNIAAALRKPGSNARPLPAAKPVRAEPIITSATRLTLCPVGVDQRYTVRELPPGYRSALDPRDCRAWAHATAGGRAA
jgi:hypothetical protein